MAEQGRREREIGKVWHATGRMWNFKILSGLRSAMGRSLPGCLERCITAAWLSIEACEALSTWARLKGDVCIAGKPFGVLKRWNADVKIGWRVAAPFLHRVANGGGATLMLGVSVFAHALLFRFDPAAMKAVLSLHAHAIYYFRYFQFRQLRPQVRLYLSAVGTPGWFL